MQRDEVGPGVELVQLHLFDTEVNGALFVGGVIPGILACVLLIIPALYLSRKHNFGVDLSTEPLPRFWPSLKDASWALSAPVLILGGLRTGWFTPTEAAAVAAFWALCIGGLWYRNLTWASVVNVLRESELLSLMRRKVENELLALLLGGTPRAIELGLRRRRGAPGSGRRSETRRDWARLI